MGLCTLDQYFDQKKSLFSAVLSRKVWDYKYAKYTFQISNFDPEVRWTYNFSVASNYMKYSFYVHFAKYEKKITERKSKSYPLSRLPFDLIQPLGDFR